MSELYDRPTSDELDELLGAYALDAVDLDERRVLDEYLASNPRAAAEVEQHREVSTLLAFSGSDAPEGLWDRIVATLDEPAPDPGPELAKVLPVDANRRRRSTLASFGKWSLASAAAAVVAVSAVMVFDLGRGASDPLRTAVDSARGDRDARSAVLVNDEGLAIEVIVDESGLGYILGADLPQLPRDLTYQLWGVVGEQVISIGILGPSPQIATFTAKGDLSALAITIEPSGGVISDGNPEGWYFGELT